MLRFIQICLFVILIHGKFAYSAYTNNNYFTKIVPSHEEDLLVTTFKYKDTKITDSFLIYTNTNGEALIPFTEFIKLMNLDIKVNNFDGTASGKFLNNHSFDMNIPNKIMTVDKQKIKLTENDFERQMDEIYVTLDFLMVVLPIDIVFDMRELTISMKSSEMFPIDIEMESEMQRRRLAKQNAKESKINIYNENKSLFSAPFVDLSINTFSQKNKITKESTKNNAYSVVSRERILGLDTEFSMFDASTAIAKQVRLRAGREFENNKLGIVRNFSMGDVISQSFPIASSNTMGRGISFSTAKTNGISDDKTVTIDGPISAGWEVELYRNDQLIKFNADSTNGRYLFEKVPLMSGNNDFTLKFYGPNGQRREEKRKFFLQNGNIVNKGEFNVKFSAVQENRYLFEDNKYLENIQTKNNEGDVIAVVDYGVTDAVTVSVGASHINNARAAYLLQTTEKVDQNFILTGLKTTAFGVAMEYNNVFTKDSQKSPAHYFSIQGATKNFRINLLHEEYGEIKTMKSMYYNTFVKSFTNANVSNQIPLLKGYSIPLMTNLNFYKSHKGELAYNNTFQAFIPLYGIFNLTGEYQSAREFNGNLNNFVNTRLNMNYSRISIRTEAFYLLKPYKQLNNIRSTIEYRATQRIMLATRFMRFYFKNSPVPVIDRYAIGTSILTPIGSLRFDVYKEKQTQNVGLNFSYNVGIGYNPATNLPILQENGFGNTGAIMADAYLDKNYNYKYDKGETILKDIPIKMPYSAPVKPNKRTGKLLKTNLPSYEKFEIEVSEESLASKNTSLIAPQKIGAKVRPSAITKVHIPIQEVADIEGMLYLKSNGKMNPLKGIKMYVLNKSGKITQEIVSDYDGVFVFEKLPFDTYKIMFDEKQLEAIGYKVLSTKDSDITLNEENPLYYCEDTILVKK